MSREAKGTRMVSEGYVGGGLGVPGARSFTKIIPLACRRAIARNCIDCSVDVRRVAACENMGGRKGVSRLMSVINTLYKTWFRSRSIVTAFSASARFLKANTHRYTPHVDPRQHLTCTHHLLHASCLQPPASCTTASYTPRSSIRCRAAHGRGLCSFSHFSCFSVSYGPRDLYTLVPAIARYSAPPSAPG